MKKFNKNIVAVLFTATILSGCGNSPETSQGIPMTTDISEMPITQESTTESATVAETEAETTEATTSTETETTTVATTIPVEDRKRIYH